MLAAVGAATLAGARTAAAQPTRPYLFFSAAEARFIEPACECLIPSSEEGPGALHIGVPGYMDRQLVGPWGYGTEMWRTDPWRSLSLPEIRLPHPPAQAFRRALAAINGSERTTDGCGRGFDRLPFAQQDVYLRMLQAGTRDLGGVPSGPFFQMLLKLTVEGFFGAGGSRSKLRWCLPGLAGAMSFKRMSLT